MNVELARVIALNNIARNPTEIVIRRSEVQGDDGAGGEIRVSKSLPPQTVRIFISSLAHHEKTKEGGTVQSQRWGLLAAYDADIKKGDTFDVGSKHYQVKGVTTVMAKGQIIAFQGDLEEVG